MRNWLARIMNGRYGMDKLSQCLLIVWFALAALNIFIGSTAIAIIQFIPAVLFLLRFFSRNAAARSAENRLFLEYWKKLREWFAFQYKKLSEIGTHRYIKCPDCKAVLRVPRKTGTHTAVCPRCGKRFEKKIIL